MLKLIFHVGDHQYALDCSYVKLVIPQVRLTDIPGCSPAVVGMLNLGGKPMPVIDMCRLIEGRPSSSSFHSRIVVLEFLHNGLMVRLGLMAEKVMETIDKPDTAFVESTLRVGHLPFIKGVLSADQAFVQLIDVPGLVDMIYAEGIAINER